MDRLKVLVVETSIGERQSLQDALQPTGILGSLHVVTLSQLEDALSQENDWDLICARYSEATSGRLLPLLASVLKKGIPPVFFLVDDFNPRLVLDLQNAGARRVLWLPALQRDLPPSLEAVFQPSPLYQLLTDALDSAARQQTIEAESQDLSSLSAAFERVVWQSPDAIMIYCPDGRLQYLNPSARAWFGLGEQELVDQAVVYRVYPERVQHTLREEIHPQVEAQGSWRGELHVRAADGRLVPVMQTILCQKDNTGRLLSFVSHSHDLTKNNQAEADLNRYRALVETAHDFVYVVGAEGLLEYANPLTCQLVGADPAAVEGTPVAAFFPICFADNLLQMIVEVREINTPVYTEGTLEVQGQAYWLSTWLVPIYDAQERFVSILGTSRDITDQKQADEALKHGLQTEKQLNEMRSSFFSMTSHQFRTPLSTILLSIELLLKYGSSWDDAKRSEHLRRVQEAAHRLHHLLEDILMITRLELGRYAPAPKEFDLIEFCENMLQEIAVNDRDLHQIDCQHTPEQITVFADQSLLGRVFDNLLSNALKYSPDGTCVTVRLEQEGNQILIDVTDQGMGIPEREMMNLFQPFQRASNAIEIPGTGIGLTIVKKSIELMSGTVFLKSKEGQGTTFRVGFPTRFTGTNGRVII